MRTAAIDEGPSGKPNGTCLGHLQHQKPTLLCPPGNVPPHLPLVSVPFAQTGVQKRAPAEADRMKSNYRPIFSSLFQRKAQGLWEQPSLAGQPMGNHLCAHHHPVRGYGEPSWKRSEARGVQNASSQSHPSDRWLWEVHKEDAGSQAVFEEGREYTGIATASHRQPRSPGI